MTWPVVGDPLVVSSHLFMYLNEKFREHPDAGVLHFSCRSVYSADTYSAMGFYLWLVATQRKNISQVHPSYGSVYWY